MKELEQIIHNENILNVPMGELYLNDAWILIPIQPENMGRLFILMGKKIKFCSMITQPSDCDMILRFHYIIKLAPGLNNDDTDITRKGSTATVEPDHWWKVEIKNNIMQGVVYKKSSSRSEIAEKDTLDRRDGNWHFVAYTREGNTCSLIVDSIVYCSIQNQLLDKYRKHRPIGHRGEGY